MMQQRKPFTFNWKKLIFYFLLVMILILIIYVFSLYRYIVQSKTIGFEEASQFIYAETTIISLNDAAYFQDKDGYFTFTGKDATGEDYYIFLKDSNNFNTEHLTLVAVSETVPLQQLERQIQVDCESCKLIKTNLAMIDQIPLLELIYEDEEKQYNIEYKYLADGTTYEKLRLKKK